MAADESSRRRSTRELLWVAVPAAGVGVASALLLAGLSAIAEALQTALWDWLPDRAGVPTDSPWWTIGVLTLTGLVVGATIQFVPGRAGTDPATVELFAPPLPLWVVPSVALALVVGLAGGVSLGPENPILAVNVAVAVWLLARFSPGTPTDVSALLAVAGTVGALFGTPVAAALILTGVLGATKDVPLFDRLFAPLVAAGAGALTMRLLGTPSFSVEVPPTTRRPGGTCSPRRWWRWSRRCSYWSASTRCRCCTGSSTVCPTRWSRSVWPVYCLGSSARSAAG